MINFNENRHDDDYDKDDIDVDYDDDADDDDVHLLPPSALTLIPLLCRLSFSRLLLRLLFKIIVALYQIS